MLSLGSPRWNELHHARGRAGDLPELLAQLARDPTPKSDETAEPWSSLWTLLCDDGDISTASYAAVPHIVDICSRAAGPVEYSFFLLPACIEIARRTGAGPGLPADLAEAYGRSLHRLQICAARHGARATDDSMLVSIACALAAARGDIALAEAISDLNAAAIETMAKHAA